MVPMLNHFPVSFDGRASEHGTSQAFGEEMTMEYRASIFANRRFGIFVVSMTTFLLGLLVFAMAYGLALSMVIVVVIAVARLNTRRMSFSSDKMRYEAAPDLRP